MCAEFVIDGVLPIDKASGMTSHDVVAIARRALGTKKIGHCGTLDPLATGLLLLTIGRGTKIQDLLMSEDKEYIGTMKQGEITDSQDADGEVIETRPVPEWPSTSSRVRARPSKGNHASFISTPIRSLKSVLPKLTFVLFAARDSMSVPTCMTLGTIWDAGDICEHCVAPSRGGSMSIRPFPHRNSRPRRVRLFWKSC